MSVKIIMYTSDTCGPCQQIKKYLTRKALSFEERNISNTKFMQEVWDLTGFKITPVLVIGEHTIIGPNIGEITRVLRLVT